MQRAGLLQTLGQKPAAPGTKEVGRNEPATRLQVGQQRCPAADAVEVVDGQLHPGFPRNRQQMEHGVGRPAGRGHRRDAVLERRPRHHLTRTPVGAHQIHDDPAARARDLVLLVVQRRDHVVTHRRDADQLAHGGHRVRGELSPTGACTRAGAVLERRQPRVGHVAGGVRADRLEHVLDRDVVPLPPARGDRTAVEDQTGDVEPRKRHDATRNGLVTTDQHHDPVEQVAPRHELDRIGDDLAADKRGAHPLAAHGDAIGDRHGVELHRGAARRADALLDAFTQPPQVEVTGPNLGPGVGHADDRPPECRIVEPHGLQHGTSRRPGGSVGDGAATSLAWYCAHGCS